MKDYYSESTGGFYLDAIHRDMPEDVVFISPVLKETLLTGQANGKRIMPPDAEHSLPWLAEPEPPAAEELAAAARARRDALLAASDWTQLQDSPLSDAARAAWATYRQALRDITDQPGFPQESAWPELVVLAAQE
jgi:hypothetical protein